MSRRGLSLPKVVYIHQIAGTGRGSERGSDFYGLRLGEILPTFVQATEFLDGALVSDAFGASAIKAPTWELQNNPIILDLLRRHGVDVNFLGVILMRIRYTTHHEKVLVSTQAASLAGRLGAQGRHRHLARGRQYVHRGDAHGPGVREAGDRGGARPPSRPAATRAMKHLSCTCRLR